MGLVVVRLRNSSIALISSQQQTNMLITTMAATEVMKATVTWRTTNTFWGYIACWLLFRCLEVSHKIEDDDEDGDVGKGEEGEQVASIRLADFRFLGIFEK